MKYHRNLGIHIISFRRRYVFLFFVLMPFGDVKANQAEPNSPPTITFYNAAYTPIIRQYQEEVIVTALQHASERFGESYVRFRHDIFSVKRAVKKLSSGDNFQVALATRTLTEEELKQGIFKLDTPFFFGILGLRKLIIRRDDDVKISNVDHSAAFKKLAAGLRLGWPDVGILRKGGLEVVESVNYRNLYPMLFRKRFDYIPLGLIEISEEFSKQEAYKDTLLINQDTYIYYPIPSSILVSHRYPEYKERLAYGMNRMNELGELVKIFNKHFSSFINDISPDRARVFVLGHPELSDEKNNEHIDNAMSRFFTDKTNIVYLNERK